MDKPFQVKIVMAGDSGVGKSSILLRFSNDEFDEFNEPTLGAAFVSKSVQIQEKQVKFQVWDTAGQQKYQAIAPIYYRQSEIAVCVYDIADRKSFINLQRWINHIKQNNSSIKLFAIVGNKMDKADSEEVTYPQAKEFAEKHNAIFKITSAKDGKGINDLFVSIGQMLLEWEKTGRSTFTPEKEQSGLKLENENSLNPQQEGTKRKRKRDICCKS